MGGKQNPMPTTATTMAKLEGSVRPASASGDGLSGQEVAAAGLVEQKLSQEARKEFAVTGASIFGTMMLLDDMPQALVDRADQPALLMLELSARLCLLFYLWVVFITRVLTRDRHGARRLSVRVLLCVLAWIISAVAVSGALADMAIGIVTAMLVMYIVTLCVAGLFAWCLGEYLRTRYDRTTHASF